MLLSNLKPALELLSKLPGINPAMFESLLIRFHGSYVTRQTNEAFAIVPLENGVECAVPFSSFSRIPFAEETALKLKDKLHIQTGSHKAALSLITDEPPAQPEPKGEPIEIALDSWQVDIPLAAIDRNEITTKRNLALAHGWSFATLRGALCHACKVEMPENVVITISPEVAACLSSFLPAKVKFYENVLVAESEKGKLIASLSNEGYPDFRPFLKMDCKPFATVNANDLRKAVDALSNYDEMVHMVRVQADQGAIKLSAKNNVDDGDEEVVAQTFSEASLSVNGVNFSKMLRQCDGDVQLMFGENPYPFLQVETEDRILISVGIVQRT